MANNEMVRPERQFKGVWIPAEVWCKKYESFDDRESAIHKYIANEYGVEVATSGGIKNDK